MLLTRRWRHWRVAVQILIFIPRTYSSVFFREKSQYTTTDIVLVQDRIRRKKTKVEAEKEKTWK
jgi:hypothetical protein